MPREIARSVDCDVQELYTFLDGEVVVEEAKGHMAF